MKVIPKHSFIIFAIFISLFTANLHAQNPGNLLKISNKTNPERIYKITSNSKFKIKTVAGNKLKGRISFFEKDFLVSQLNDTLFFSNILWIKAKKQLKKSGKAFGIAGLFLGIYITAPMIPGSLYIYIFTGNTLIFLAPIASTILTVTAIRTLAGRRYKTKKWNMNILSDE